jgi:hypothetical protein
MELVLWSFDKIGFEELYAISTGGVPPAEDDLKNSWKRLETGVEASEGWISKITYERPAVVLRNVEVQGYHTFEPKWLRTDWVRPNG